MIIFGGDLVLREAQPDKTVIGAVCNRASQFLDRRGVALGLIIGVGHPPPAGDQRRLLLIRRDAVYQPPAPVARRIGKLFRLVFLRQRRGRHRHQAKNQ